MADLDGLDMEMEERVESRVAGRVIDSRMESGAIIEKGKLVKGSGKANGLAKGVVLGASHPSLVEGSKRVQSAGNPNGQGSLRKMKERVLRDVTNRLEAGSVSFKPMVVGPGVVSRHISREASVYNNMA